MNHSFFKLNNVFPVGQLHFFVLFFCEILNRVDFRELFNPKQEKQLTQLSSLKKHRITKNNTIGHPYNEKVKKEVKSILSGTSIVKEVCYVELKTATKASCTEEDNTI